MFEDPFDDEKSDESDEGSGTVGPFDENLSPREFELSENKIARLPWQELDDDTAGKIEEQTDDRLCDHDEYKKVVSNQKGGGATFAGSGIQTTTTVDKIVCTKCGNEWATRNGSSQSDRNSFGF